MKLSVIISTQKAFFIILRNVQVAVKFKTNISLCSETEEALVSTYIKLTVKSTNICPVEIKASIAHDIYLLTNFKTISINS